MLKSFGQGSLAHQTAEGGTGLGLPITKGLTELHDGAFELKSKLRYLLSHDPRMWLSGSERQTACGLRQWPESGAAVGLRAR